MNKPCSSVIMNYSKYADFFIEKDLKYVHEIFFTTHS